MDFNDAILAHSRWKTRLKNHIEGQEQVDAVMTGKDDQCELGKWICGEGRKYAALSGFTDLKAKHTKFHLAAANVVTSARSCSREKALELVDSMKSEFGRASSEVINALSALRTITEKSIRAS